MLPGISSAVLLTGTDASTGPVDLHSGTIEHYVIDPADASAFWEMDTAGNVNATGITSYPWRLIGASADYEVQFDGGGWLTLSITRTLTRTRTTFGVNSHTYSVEVRHIATGVIVATATITLRAEVDL